MRHSPNFVIGTKGRRIPHRHMKHHPVAPGLSREIKERKTNNVKINANTRDPASAAKARMKCCFKGLRM